jgi:hypothetical protein
LILSTRGATPWLIQLREAIDHASRQGICFDISRGCARSKRRVWRLDVLARRLTFEVSSRRRPARVLHSARFKAKAAIHRVPPEGERSAMSLHGQRWSSGGPVFQCRPARREFCFAKGGGAAGVSSSSGKADRNAARHRVPSRAKRSAAAFALGPEAGQRGGPAVLALHTGPPRQFWVNGDEHRR